MLGLGSQVVDVGGRRSDRFGKVVAESSAGVLVGFGIVVSVEGEFLTRFCVVEGSLLEGVGLHLV